MRSVDLFDAYLNGQLNAEEKAHFEWRLKNEDVFSKAFDQHKTLLDTLSTHSKREDLKAKLKQFHSESFGKDAKVISIKQNSFMERFGKTAFIAASTGLVAVVTTIALLSAGGYLLKKQSNEITDLKREVVELKYSQNGIVTAFINQPTKQRYAPANLEGSGFALNNNGFVITSWHTINGADSIFIENKFTERTLAKVMISDPKLDIAVLKIETDTVYKNWNVPFSYSGKPSDLGEKVFTLGFPRKEVVYGEGSLSALSGHLNDTTMYQVSIPVNPGNSGGPVMDEQGNIIGMIRGKLSSAEGTSYAVKISDILNSINSSKTEGLVLNASKKSLKNLKRVDQIKKVNPYVFNIMVYKEN